MRWGHNSNVFLDHAYSGRYQGCKIRVGDLEIFQHCRVGDLEIFRKIRPCDPDISPNKRDPETHLGIDPHSFLMLYLNLSSKKNFGQPVGEISEKLTSTFCTSHQLVHQNFFLMSDSDRSSKMRWGHNSKCFRMSLSWGDAGVARSDFWV